MGPRGMPGPVGPAGVGEQGPQGQRGAPGKQGMKPFLALDHVNILRVAIKNDVAFAIYS